MAAAPFACRRKPMEYIPYILIIGFALILMELERIRKLIDRLPGDIRREEERGQRLRAYEIERDIVHREYDREHGNN
jgi:hypothetical protein